MLHLYKHLHLDTYKGYQRIMEKVDRAAWLPQDAFRGWTVKMPNIKSEPALFEFGEAVHYPITINDHYFWGNHSYNVYDWTVMGLTNQSFDPFDPFWSLPYYHSYSDCMNQPHDLPEVSEWLSASAPWRIPQPHWNLWDNHQVKSDRNMANLNMYVMLDTIYTFCSGIWFVQSPWWDMTWWDGISRSVSFLQEGICVSRFLF